MFLAKKMEFFIKKQGVRILKKYAYKDTYLRSFCSLDGFESFLE